jgi:adenine phosphoribosyltransferase
VTGVGPEPAPSDFPREVSFVKASQRRSILYHPLDGRYGPLYPKRLAGILGGLAAVIDTQAVGYVLGFPVGGSIPAFAFAQIVDRPVILSMLVKPELPGLIAFEEPHSSVATTHYVHGLRRGDRVVIVEDEVTTGQTVIGAVRALRCAGVHITDVGTVLAIDDPAMWRQMAEEKISLHAGITLPSDYAGRILANSPT